jgi:DNA repair photolyase
MTSATYELHKVKKILNVHKHVDGGWFWDKYSAHPYTGCQFGCEFCYVRDPKYLPYKDPADFCRRIKVKINAPELLQKELPRFPVDLITTGDYQPAERKYRLSRAMLGIILNLKFPVLLIERSHLVLDDIDLLTEINRQSHASVIFSLSYLDSAGLKNAFEPRSPGIKLRFKAMESLAARGIQTGTALMPILPFLSDSQSSLEGVVKATAGSGGSFVLAGGLTLSGFQKELYLNVIRARIPELEQKYALLYGNAYSPPGAYWLPIARSARELCARHGIKDRMPRPIIPGALALNKKIAEQLFLKVYDLELAGEKEYRIWAYRKAAWAVDELDRPVQEIFQAQGKAGLLAIPGIGKSIADEIAGLIGEAGR